MQDLLDWRIRLSSVSKIFPETANTYKYICFPQALKIECQKGLINSEFISGPTTTYGGLSNQWFSEG